MSKISDLNHRSLNSEMEVRNYSYVDIYYYHAGAPEGDVLATAEGGC